MAFERIVARSIGDILRIIITFTRPFSDKILSILYRIFMGPTKPLPPIRNPLLLYTASELAEKIRKRQVKCEDVMKAYVERSREVHPFINAACDERYEYALKDARNIDIFLDKNEKLLDDIERDTPLLGVPFTCKEAIGVKGMAQTCGYYKSKNAVAAQDADTTALYRKAGAIPVTVTNVPETLLWWESANLVFGMSKNPYDNTRTVGGSSGGEAAIITSAAAVIGIGSDLAGSIRMPSSFCGIFGHKPSRNYISNCSPEDAEEDALLDDFISTGPMCRYAKDLSLLVRILSDNSNKVPLDKRVNFRNVKIYYMEEIPGKLNCSTPDAKNKIHQAVKHFETTYGVTPTRLEMDELEYAFPMWECKLLKRGISSVKDILAGKDGKINLWLELLKSLFRMSNHTLPSIFLAMIERRSKDKLYHFCLQQYRSMEKKFLEIFKEDAIFLIPTHPETPPHYLMTIPKYPNIAYTCIFSILGFASTQIPAGLSHGLPFGIQAISGYYKDHLTIATAIELEEVFGGWISPSPVVLAKDKLRT
ncbi:fatty-acid amide hydrolase 2 isoform X2 [Parasteatoda tepidariorum]|uniref:fatty-acid amide hydrolase 2 isoform X2 n=1 Tax=Parasteatoda tepidariorum TaxID=114398 RepID=UPI001C7263F0|nr:fatty-acid amide hydrolase 2 isoform X1 [Parasteatoda tepidariorum]